MPRFHFFEWEDQPWFPELFRNFITDHLLFLAKHWYIPVIPILSQKMKQTQYTNIIDLCSGGGGALPFFLPRLTRKMGQAIKVTLTDLFPNHAAFKIAKNKNPDFIDYISEPITAMACPEELTGFRTIFTSFHHFQPKDAKKILVDAARKKVPIGIFEASERNLLSIILFPLMAFLTSFILTPFIGRMTIGRFIFTYIIPLAPFFYAWDSFASCVRTYTCKELNELTNDIVCPGYTWETGKVISKSIVGTYHITYLFGLPSKQTQF